MSQTIDLSIIIHPALVDYKDKVVSIFTMLKNPMLTASQRLSELEKVKSTLSLIKDQLVKAKENSVDITINAQLDAMILYIDSEYNSYLQSFVSGDNVVTNVDPTEGQALIFVDGGVVDSNQAPAVENTTPQPIPVPDSSSGISLGIVMTEAPKPVAPEVAVPTSEPPTPVEAPSLTVSNQMAEEVSAAPSIVPSQFHKDQVAAQKEDEALYVVAGGKAKKVASINELKEAIKEAEVPLKEITVVYGRVISIDVVANL